jgi:predicted dehydrogenase
VAALTTTDRERRARPPAVIVGYGHAGQDLHHRALRALYGNDTEVFAVDPPLRDTPPRVHRLPSLKAAADCCPVAETVFHVTTPPAVHLECVAELVLLGARRIILEKPIAPNAAESRQLCELADRSQAQILPVSVWPNSRVTERVRQIIASGEIGELVSLHIEQSKPRFSRTSTSDSHLTAFEVELPHQALLALYLAGPETKVLPSPTWSMPLPDRAVPAMGGAVVRLEHADGVVSTLLSDLTSPVRRRRLRVNGTKGEVVADFPVSSQDSYGQVRISDQPGRAVIEDAPVTQFIAAAYAYFTGAGPLPPADLALHHRAISLLERARECAVPAAPEPAVAW